jgi:hypothetical protein
MPVQCWSERGSSGFCFVAVQAIIAVDSAVGGRWRTVFSSIVSMGVKAVEELHIATSATDIEARRLDRSESTTRGRFQDGDALGGLMRG